MERPVGKNAKTRRDCFCPFWYLWRTFQPSKSVCDRPKSQTASDMTKLERIMNWVGRSSRILCWVLWQGRNTFLDFLTSWLGNLKYCLWAPCFLIILRSGPKFSPKWLIFFILIHFHAWKKGALIVWSSQRISKPVRRYQKLKHFCLLPLEVILQLQITNSIISFDLCRIISEFLGFVRSHLWTIGRCDVPKAFVFWVATRSNPNSQLIFKFTLHPYIDRDNRRAKRTDSGAGFLVRRQ